MPTIVRELRALYHRGLLLVLFPVVFLVTLLEALPRDWQDGMLLGLVQTIAVTTLMALGLIAVYVLKLTF